MGQRLNIEIFDDGKLLANAYYHWDAYTSAAAERTKEIIELLNVRGTGGTGRLLLAIRALEATGAGLTSEELPVAAERCGMDPAVFDECLGRNAGLIAITDKGMAETRAWEEGRVTIHMDKHFVDFACFYTDNAEDWEREQRDWEDNPDADYNKLPKVNVDFNCISFDSFADVAKDYMNGEFVEPFASTMHPNVVLIPIE